MNIILSWSLLSLVLLSHSQIHKFNVELTMDMYTPLARLTGEIFPVYGTTHFISLPPPTTTTTTTHPSTHQKNLFLKTKAPSIIQNIWLD